MGILDGAKDQIREQFIARPESAKNEIIFKWPDRNIRQFTALTVEQDEVALFFKDGVVVGQLKAGLHQIDGTDIPFLGKLVDDLTNHNLLLAELYFVSIREHVDLPFGGPIDNVLDPVTNLLVGLQVFGDFSLLVNDPTTLVLKLVGTKQAQSNDEVMDWAKEQLLLGLRTAVSLKVTKGDWSVLGITGFSDEIKKESMERANPELAPYGLGVTRLGNFVIQVRPEDREQLQEFLRKIAEINKQAGGDIMRLAAAHALEGMGEGAAQGNSGASNAMGLLAGVGLGGAMGGVVGAGMGMNKLACPKCNAGNDVASKFCSHCGSILKLTNSTASLGAGYCSACGGQLSENAKFCAKCGVAIPAQ